MSLTRLGTILDQRGLFHTTRTKTAFCSQKVIKNTELTLNFEETNILPSPRAPALEHVRSLIEKPEVSPLKRLSKKLELRGSECRSLVLGSWGTDDRIYQFLVTRLGYQRYKEKVA